MTVHAILFVLTTAGIGAENIFRERHATTETATIDVPFSTVIFTPIIGSPEATSHTCPRIVWTASLVCATATTGNSSIVKAAPKNNLLIFFFNKQFGFRSFTPLKFSIQYY